jgi:hypothetical protein
MHRRVFRAVILAAGLALLTSGAVLAGAGGRGTVTFTQQFRNIALFPPQAMTNPCTGAAGTLTAIAKTAIFHATTFTTGPEFWFTGTDEGTVTFTPDDPSGVSATGHYAEWFGESFNNQNDVQHFTSTFRLKGSDGSSIFVHEVTHFSVNANGVITVNFDKPSVHCG